jgi:hypothetical protein
MRSFAARLRSLLSKSHPVNPVDPVEKPGFIRFLPGISRIPHISRFKSPPAEASVNF